jgi:transposase
VRGGDDRTGELFSYVDLEARVRRNHPLRTIRAIRERGAVAGAGLGCVVSERLLVERLEYDLLFRWFVGIGVDDAAFQQPVAVLREHRMVPGWTSRRSS